MKIKYLIGSVVYSTLLFVRVWNEKTTFWEYASKRANLSDLSATLIDILLVAVLFYCAAILVNKLKSRLVSNLCKLFPLLIVLDSVNYSRHLFGVSLKSIGTLYLVIIILVIALSIWSMIRYGRFVFNKVFDLSIMISPFVVIVFGSSLCLIAKYNTARFEDKPVKPLALQKSEKRVLWLIFDGADQNLIFESRPKDLRLPELERFVAGAVTASNAFPPASNTLESLPSLITGQVVAHAKPGGADELLLQFSGKHDFAKWSECDNVFSQAQKSGSNTALVGWYHPYGRLLNKSLNYCRWVPGLDVSSGDEEGLLYNMVKQLYQALKVPDQSPDFVTACELNDHIARYRGVMEASREVVTNKNYNFVTLHLPTPHDPFIFDRASNDFKKSYTDRVSDLYGNVLLMDRTLATLRGSLEQAGLWNKTTLIISSDHWWKGEPNKPFPNYYRIPFMVRVAGDNSKCLVKKDINTVITAELIHELLTGSLTTNSQVANWLTAHPYTKVKYTH